MNLLKIQSGNINTLQTSVVKFSGKSIESSQSKMAKVKMSHRTTRQSTFQVLEVMKVEKVEKFADAGQSAFIKLWYQAMAVVDCFARKLVSAACCDEEEMVQEKKYAEPGLYLELKPELLWDAKVAKADSEVVAGEEIDKRDISFPHEPGAGTMEKATLVKLMTSETRLKCAIKALDSMCNTEVEALSWDKLERISARLEEHWNSYEDAFIAYQKLYSTVEDKHFFTLLEAFMAVDQRAWTLLEISLSGGNANYKLLLEEFSLKIKKVQLNKVEMYWWRVASLIDQQGDESKFAADDATPKFWRPWEQSLVDKDGEMEDLENKAEQLDFKKLMLRQHNLKTKEVEQSSEVPQNIVELDPEEVSSAKRDSELKQDSHPHVLQGKGREVSDMKAETETKMNKTERAQEKNVQLKQRLMEISTQGRLVEKNWQGSLPLVVDKQDLMEVSVSKKLKTRLMHALNQAEIVQVRNMKQNVMVEELLEFCKQCLEVEKCEKERREALPLLIDKQAAAAG